MIGAETDATTIPLSSDVGIGNAAYAVPWRVVFPCPTPETLVPYKIEAMVHRSAAAILLNDFCDSWTIAIVFVLKKKPPSSKRKAWDASSGPARPRTRCRAFDELTGGLDRLLGLLLTFIATIQATIGTGNLDNVYAD